MNGHDVGRRRLWAHVALGVLLVLIGERLLRAGFAASAGDSAFAALDGAASPVVGLLIGIVATALIQSSTVVTTTVVTLVATGLPMDVAIAAVIGANIGTTVTGHVVALTFCINRTRLAPAFAVSSTHSLFNLGLAAVLIPLEWTTGLLNRTAGYLAPAFSGFGWQPATLDVLGVATRTLSHLTRAGFASMGLPPGLVGVFQALTGGACLILGLAYATHLLKQAFVGRADTTLASVLGRSAPRGMLHGALITAALRSSSAVTSLLVMGAAGGVTDARRAYAFIIGANLGTTLSALLGALAFSGLDAELAARVAIVHAMFNGLGALIALLMLATSTTGRWAFAPATAGIWLGRQAARCPTCAVLAIPILFCGVPYILLTVFN